jgi:hypothetical protein
MSARKKRINGAPSFVRILKSFPRHFFAVAPDCGICEKMGDLAGALTSAILVLDARDWLILGRRLPERLEHRNAGIGVRSSMVRADGS